MNKLQVGIFLFDSVEVLDFAGPFEVFSVTATDSGNPVCKVHTIAKNRNPITAINGLSVNPDYDFTNHPPIDILIIPGGSGTKLLLDDSESLNWIKKNNKTARYTLCICSGARIFAKLGLLANKQFCTHQQVYDDVLAIAPDAIPAIMDRFIQTDEKLFTSGGISAGIDLSFHIVELLFGKTIAGNTATYMEYNRI
jgi:transcriptional regulator GlxA family with amidase domain